VELTPRIMELEGGSYYRGHDGVREWWRTLFAVFPDFSKPLGCGGRRRRRGVESCEWPIWWILGSDDLHRGRRN
jgi:hypothetical protein